MIEKPSRRVAFNNGVLGSPRIRKRFERAHEIDRLEGLLAIDRLTDIKSICTRAEFERRYKRQLRHEPSVKPAGRHISSLKL